MKLKLSDIRIDGDTQARVALNQDKVKDYADQMRDGRVFDAVRVCFDGSDHWLVDGFHRYFASKQSGFPDIECEVEEGTQRDAQWSSFGANADHGLQYTSEDIRNIISRIFNDEEWSKHSNNEIAKHVGCSAMTVGRVKKALEERRKAEEGGAEAEPEVVVYTNKHGQQAEMKVNNLGKKKEEPPRVDLGAPPSMSEEDETEQQIKELEFQVTELANENQKLKDAIAVGQFEGSDIEKADIEDTIKDLREQLRVKDIEIAALRESRDTYQNRAAELMKQVKSLQAKLKKLGAE